MPAPQASTAAQSPSAGVSPLRRDEVVVRVLASLVGSYAFVWGVVSIVMALGAQLMPFADARTLSSLLAFLILLFCFCWAFVAKSVLRVWIVLLGGGGVLTAAAWLLTRVTS